MNQIHSVQDGLSTSRSIPVLFFEIQSRHINQTELYLLGWGPFARVEMINMSIYSSGLRDLCMLVEEVVTDD